MIWLFNSRDVNQWHSEVEKHEFRHVEVRDLLFPVKNVHFQGLAEDQVAKLHDAGVGKFIGTGEMMR